jgi:RimJ/RimL family protein N-acetyltransferase
MEFMGRRLSCDESDAMAARLQAELQQRGWGLWAVEVQAGAPFIGFVGLSIPGFDAHFIRLQKVAYSAFCPRAKGATFARFTPCVEIGWRLARDHWHHGYASEAATESLRFAFQELQLPQVVSFTTALNKRSVRVMENIGMSRDRTGDFEHPGLAPSHPLRLHVLYRANRDAWLKRT